MAHKARDRFDEVVLRYMEYMEKKASENIFSVPLHVFHIMLRMALNDCGALTRIEIKYYERNGELPDCMWFSRLDPASADPKVTPQVPL